MLPVINLDDENFKDIFEEARQMISGVYPAWTDYNEHDPGITFLELFSWFKEMQQYHMNQIGRDNYLMYLKLLGMQQKKKEAAKALVEFKGVESPTVLPKGSQLFAGDITFETTSKENLECAKILSCAFKGKSNNSCVQESTMINSNNMDFYLFGEQPEVQDEFHIILDRELEAVRVHSIYFKIFEDYPVKRNPIIEEEFIPLAKLSMEYYHEGKWNPCEVIRDETFQFIQSGKIYFRTDKEMQALEGGYPIRFRLLECNYDLPPIVQGICFNIIKVGQLDTYSEYEDYSLIKNDNGRNELFLDSYLAINGIQEIYIREEQGFRRIYDYQMQKSKEGTLIIFENLFQDTQAEQINLRIVNYKSEFGYRKMYETNGFPYQKLELEDEEILYDSLEIFVENELFSGYYNLWEKVDNFYCSNETDRHYVFDEVKGIIHFGNGENGISPEGNVIIIGYANSLGVRGNVKAHQINRIVNGPEGLIVANPDNAYHGRDKEAMDECFNRFIKEFRQVKRAITNEDYEQIILQTPGLMIQNVKAIPLSMLEKWDGSIDENSVTMVVRPYTKGQSKGISHSYLQNINQILNKRRLVGTKINILSPEYIGISIFGEIVVKPHYINAYDIIKTAVEEYFEKSGGIFGKPVLYSEIYGIIDVLDCVSQVQNLSINSQGRGILRSMNGDLILPVNGLVYLKEAQYQISSAE